MKEEISKGVMQVQKIDGKRIRSAAYQVSCSCTDPNCNLCLDLTWYESDGDVDLSFWRNLDYYEDYNKTRFEEWLSEIRESLDRKSKSWDILYDIEMKISDVVRSFRRIRDAYRILTHKEIKLEGGLVIYGEDQIETFINALIEGLNFTYPSKERSMVAVAKDEMNGKTDIGTV